METLTWLLSILSFVFLVVALTLLSPKTKRRLPPSPPAIPFLGHIHLLKLPLHRTLTKLSDKLGPIFSLRMGTHRLMVVVSSEELVSQCFTENDLVLANRPRLIISKHIGYNYTTLAGASYGDHWRNLRRLTTLEVFSSTRLNKFQSLRQDETRILLGKLYEKSHRDFTRVKLRDLLMELMFNNIMRMVAGKRYSGEENEEAKQFSELIEEVLSYGGVSNPADFFPVLRWIDYKGFEKKLARVSGNMNRFLQQLIDERKQNNTMIDHLLSLQETEPEYYNDVTIKGIILVMLVAGTDTSAVTIEWAMTCLLNHPEKLHRARIEIDNLIGDARLINESDLSKLPYLQNIISETLRLFPSVPLLLPHEAAADCSIGGYDIPRGTILIVNAWAMHRDPETWEDPTRFEPERFESVEFGPTKVIPFGLGRRACPGMGLAQRVVGLTLGSLIQCFEWARVGEGLIDLREGSGLTMPKVVPLEAMCKARDVLRKALAESTV